MQRVAIFQFNWGRKLALLVILAFSVLVASLFIYNTHVHAADKSTYSTETSANIQNKLKALIYYASIKRCIQFPGYNWKTTISGGDIDKGPRWWIQGDNIGGQVYIGQIIDTWGDKNGVTNCSGENDSSPGWVNDMFSVFGLTLGSDKRAALTALGYNCQKSGDQWSCTNNDIDSATSKNGILYQVRHASYLNGVDPTTLQPDYNAMSYYLAMQGLTTTSMCKAQKNGSSDLVTIAQVQPDGTVTKGDWSIKNDGGPSRTVNSGYPIGSVAETTCEDLAAATVKYSGDYAKWSGISACAVAHPDKAGDQNFLSACATGRADPKNYSMCGSTYFSDKVADNFIMRNACWIGQGLPADVNGTSSGMLCFGVPNNYTSNALGLTACINGSLNQSDVNYCNVTYPAPEIIPNRPAPKDTNAVSREACQTGQMLPVTGGGVPTDASLTSSDGNGPGDTKTACGVEGIGWIVCPVISFMGDMLASAFSGLADNFLAVNTSLFDTSSGTYLAWSVFRTFANIAFVIVFLIIIFSQLTGVGVSNYGVKKLLPRIVIAAILVNLSYFICQLAVDLSNILGYSLKQVFDGIAITAAVPTSSDASANGFGITAIILAVIATATIAYFALSILIPILLGALVGVLMVVLMLIARKAIIILLIVLSPLAFVAFLLPNTEPLFTKWRKAFMALLLLFPIISIVFGASSLASQIILKAGPGTGDATILKIMAVGIAALPFFLVPTLLKGSLNGIGTVGAKLNGFANKAGGGLGKAGAKGFANTALARGRALRQQSRASYRNDKFAKAIAKGGARATFAKGANLTGAQKYANAALERTAVAASLKTEDEELNAAKSVMTQANFSGKQRHELATTGSTTDNTGRVHSGETMQKAAIQEVFRAGSYDEQQSVLRQSHNASADGSRAAGSLSKFQQTIANSAVSNGMASKDPALAGKRIDEIAQGSFDYDGAVKAAAAEGKYTPEALASMNDDARANAIRVANAEAAGGDGSTLLALRRGAAGITAEMKGKMSTSTAAAAQFRELS